MAKRKHAQQAHRGNDEQDAHEAMQAPAKSGGSAGSPFSPAFLQGAIVVLGILVVISGYWLGYQYGQLNGVSGGAYVAPTAASAPAPTQAAAPSVPPPPTVPKTAKPTAELFIMSYCPYGLQMQKAFVQAEELLGQKADMQVRFVNYVMHGEKEMQDNTREYCIQKEQPSKWIAFQKCFVASTNYQQCAQQAGIDTAKVDSCYAATDAQFGLQAAWDDQASWLSGRYAKYPLFDALNQQYGVQGSPTFIINGQEVSVPRSAEAVKQAICNGFTNPPAECQQALNANQEQPGAGPIGAGSAPAAAPAAGCGV